MFISQNVSLLASLLPCRQPGPTTRRQGAGVGPDGEQNAHGVGNWRCTASPLSCRGNVESDFECFGSWRKIVRFDVTNHQAHSFLPEFFFASKDFFCCKQANVTSGAFQVFTYSPHFTSNWVKKRTPFFLFVHVRSVSTFPKSEHEAWSTTAEFRLLPWLWPTRTVRTVCVDVPSRCFIQVHVTRSVTREQRRWHRLCGSTQQSPRFP